MKYILKSNGNHKTDSHIRQTPYYVRYSSVLDIGGYNALD